MLVPIVYKLRKNLKRSLSVRPSPREALAWLMSAQDENFGPLVMRVLPQTSRGDANLSNLSQVALEMRPQKSTDRTAGPSASRPILPPLQDARMFAAGLVSPHCLQAAARQLWALRVR